MSPRPLNRRQFLLLSGGALTLAACGNTGQGHGAHQSAAPGSTSRSPIRPTDGIVGTLETERAGQNAGIVRAVVTAAPTTVDLAGRMVSTWAYGADLAPKPIRAKAGEILEVELVNNLPDPTTIHWHGLALRNDMDGVPDMTQAPVAAGQRFTYKFALPDPGTYWFHPHTGLQLDRGLYAPLIIDDPADPGKYDAEHIIVLDDWLDGFDMTPEAVLEGLKSSPHMNHGGGDTTGTTMDPNMDHSQHSPPAGDAATTTTTTTTTTTMDPNMDHSTMPMGNIRLRPVSFQSPGILMEPGDDHSTTTTTAPNQLPAAGAAMGQFRSEALGGDAGDVSYPLHLINGKPTADRATFDAPAGGKVRFRLINAGSDTGYRFAIGGHKLRVTHTDGFPIDPVEVDALIIGMGERYDVEVTATSGAWPIVAVAEGKGTYTAAVMRTTDAAASAAPPVDAQVSELMGKLLNYKDLQAASSVRLSGSPDKTIDVDLQVDMMGYAWGINGIHPAGHGGGTVLEIERGQRVRFNLKNSTTMWHPMHLHGHTFGLAGDYGTARKDTVNVLPGQTVPVDFVADNPGQWMMHCHNTYHLESGMAATVSYVETKS